MYEYESALVKPDDVTGEKITRHCLYVDHFYGLSIHFLLLSDGMTS